MGTYDLRVQATNHYSTGPKKYLKIVLILSITQTKQAYKFSNFSLYYKSILALDK